MQIRAEVSINNLCNSSLEEVSSINDQCLIATRFYDFIFDPNESHKKGIFHAKGMLNGLELVSDILSMVLVIQMENIHLVYTQKIQKFQKLLFRTPCYTLIRVFIRGREILVFRIILRS